MADAEQQGTPDLVTLTSRIAAAYVGGNKIAADALPGLIRSVHAALAAATTGGAGKPEAAERKPPAVPVKRSVHREYLVCLEDGAHVKVLTRYLKRFGLTPETYRAKWDLPREYPMVAPAFAEQRSAVAKQIGLGRKRSDTPAAEGAPEEAEEMPEVQAAAPEPDPEPPTPEPTAEARPARKPARKAPAAKKPAAKRSAKGR